MYRENKEWTRDDYKNAKLYLDDFMVVDVVLS